MRQVASRIEQFRDETDPCLPALIVELKSATTG
jgi:hypothetical protein